jgi:hypothetical protein
MTNKTGTKIYHTTAYTVSPLMPTLDAMSVKINGIKQLATADVLLHMSETMIAAGRLDVASLYFSVTTALLRSHHIQDSKLNEQLYKRVANKLAAAAKTSSPAAPTAKTSSPARTAAKPAAKTSSSPAAPTAAKTSSPAPTAPTAPTAQTSSN